ncbi:MAG: DNA polymerase III subunit delta [Prevotella sp.]|nr:DNA polymerase III subunit delta [Alistipes senegalensis]MCM1358356.1 DNA polymerase III subunit delta [Prevotella sp.]MCM1474349.1 DNA polymerase III subunit delta [Muribaculaceae bacterium]
MPVKDQKTIEKNLKKGEIDNIYYVYGQNITGVQKLTRQIIKSAVGENEDFALTRIDGKKIDFSELYDTIQIMPMMSEYNCILINDYNCEKPREDMRGQTADTFNKKLLETLKDIPPSTVVIFNVTGFEVKTKKGKITDKNKKLADFAAKNGTVCEMGLLSPAEMTDFILSEVSAGGASISKTNARELADMCLYDVLTVENEVNKLCSYAQGREITRDILELLVHRQTNITVFQLADAVASFNRQSAFNALNELMTDKNNRGSVLANITNSFLDMYRASCAKNSGRGIPDVMGDYSYVWEFKVKNAFRDSSRMSTTRIRTCIKILRDTAVQLNSTATDEKIVLEQAITKMLMTK